MAVYKVPQDVEADDKLIGPFSFRQFVYLIIVALSIAAAWALGQLFLPLIIIPLPVILLFGALALPLRKDQPMEIYLAAIVSFHLKPRNRLWKPDGLTSLIEITVPKIAEVQRTKDLSQGEAERRLSYLANIVDTQGWSVRGVGAAPNSPMNSDVYYEAQQTEDILDNSAPVSQNIDHMIDAADSRRRQEMIDRMHQQPAAPVAPVSQITNPYDTFLSDTPQTPVDNFVAMPTPAAPQPAADDTSVHFNPYPANIHQSVVRPLSDQPAPAAPTSQTLPPQPAPTTSAKPVSPDIINLANQHDLSIEAMAREANRITQKEQKLSEDEVVISLR